MKAYLSHYIRGKAGSQATAAEMQMNCTLAKAYGNMLKMSLPDLDLYIPAEHEEFIQRAYDYKYLTEKQILDIDCNIIKSCGLLIVYNKEGISSGMQTEIDFAEKNNIPVLYLRRL